MKTDFLVVQYAANSFLINREQFATSLYLEKEFPIKSSFKYFSTLTEYDENYLIVFDFDRYLNDLFNCASKEESKLILITDINLFAEVHQKLFDSLRLRKHNELFSKRYIAIKVCNTTKLESIPLVDLKLIPHSIRSAMGQNGMLGLRFQDNKKIQYFVDCETIMVNQFKKRRII